MQKDKTEHSDHEHSRENKSSLPTATDSAMGRMSRWIALRVPFLLFVTAIVFLGFVGGAMITVAGIKPAGYFRDAYRAGTALYVKYTRYHDPFSTDLWAQAKTPQSGVSVHNRRKASDGLTLYTSGHANKAFLIDMQGRVIHEWERPFSTVWDGSAAVRKPAPDDRTNLLKAHLFPNGDLLAIYIGVGDTPYGYGMVKLDRESQLIWKNLDFFHHDFAVGPDGLIYGLTQDFRSGQPEGVDHLELPVLDDFLVIVSPEGRTLKKISLLDAVNKSDFRRLLWLIPYYSLADPLHTNNVDLLDEKTAARLRNKIPAAAPGQILLSFRELAGGTIALLDVAEEKIVWAARGPWLAQHDPDLLPNGNIMIFDNRGNFGKGGESRVIEVDPGAGTIVWEYAGTAGRPFQSMIRSDQQLLPNGNILITESDGGRLLEVNRKGETVWEFTNPVRAGAEQQLIAVVNWAQRIDPQDLSADFLDELNETLMAREDTTP
ncbi:MAG: hypothetical protein C4519_21190 [Desulfobacteraceae bacterium]|nr:MAG: hypothetical protein C4519_21190 [Desulfobacteraceae bacterium]